MLHKLFIVVAACSWLTHGFTCSNGGAITCGGSGKVPRRAMTPMHSSKGLNTPPSLTTVFTAEFGHVKKSLSTLLKFWLIGGLEGKAVGWTGTGELEALHSNSGTVASIEVDVESSTVSLVSRSEPSLVGSLQMSIYAHALLDELYDIASTEEAAEGDRLCFPPEAATAARESLSVKRE